MDLLYTIFISPIEAGLNLVLSISYLATGHYGASLLMLSLCVNLALLPIYHVADKWQQAEWDVRSRLRPKLQELREAFSGEERFMMIRTLYRQAGYHPIYAARSSMGFLIQVPFFIAAYHLLSHYPQLEGVPTFIFEDLSKPDGLLGGINVMPLVMTTVNLLSAYVYAQKLRRSDIVQLWVISLLFLVLLYSSAVALLLYWTFNNVFSLLKNMAYARLTLKRSTRVGQVVECRRKLARLIELRTTVNVALFLVVGAVQTALHINRLSSVGGVLDKSGPIGLLIGVASLVILAYLCMAFSWKAYLGENAVASGADVRQDANVFLVWLLFAVLVVVNGVRLSKSSPDLPYHAIVGGILLMLSFLLFASPVCGSLRILRKMPDSPSLYVISTSLLAFSVFVSNPLSVYVHSGDFSGGVYNVIGALLVYFVAAMLAFTCLYLLGDNPVKQCLTAFSVFSALSAIAYSAIGIKHVGLMVHFKLGHPDLLIRTNLEIVTEVAILLALFGATTYVTISYQRNVTRVTSAMLFAALCVAAADAYTYEGNDDAVAVHRGLPVNNQDIIGFSGERNVLIILLDGFPGGYIQKIINEAPDTLRDYEGFEWYPNTLTISAATISSIASLAGGGDKYTVQRINNGNYGSIGNAIKEAYRVYPDAFIPKGYQVTYLVDPAYGNGCESIDKRVLCITTIPYGIYYHDKEEPDAPLLHDSHDYLPPVLSMLSVFKVSPFFLKHWIYNGGNFRGAFPETLRTRRTNTLKMNDWGFLHVLARESNANSMFKTFKFIHLQIPHSPYAFSDDCRLLPPRATVFTETVCALKEIGVLLSWLKKNGIYDATKIVVVSDHGWWVDNPMFPPDFSQTIPKGDRYLAGPGIVQPLLLVKDFGAKGNMSRSGIFLSNSDVASIVCATVGGCRDVGPDPIKTDLGDRILTFAIVAENNPKDEKAPKFEILRAYKVINNIFNPRNWMRVK